MANTYTVKKGDTLSEIAVANSTTVAKLVDLNDITNPDYIVVGQVLVLPGGSSGGTTKKKNNTSRPIIKAFGLQANTDNTIYATWKWDKDHTEEYRVVWYYATGDGVWFVGNDSTVKVKQSTYSAPSNATKVKFKVLPKSKTRKVNKKDTTYWTAKWSTEKVYNMADNPPDIPSVPSVSISKYKLTAEVDCYDTKTDTIEFVVVKNDKTKFKSGKGKVVKNHASWSCTVDAGGEYKVKARGVKEYKRNGKTKYEYGKYSEYSANVGTIPSASKGIIKLKTQSETSVMIDWENVKNATSYEIQYTTKKGYFDSSTEVQSMTVESVVGHAEVTGLESGNEYFFRVRAVNDQGSSAWTAIKSIIVGKEPSAPTTWSSTTTTISGNEVTIYWTHNSQDESDQSAVKMELQIGTTTYLITDTKKGSSDNDTNEVTETGRKLTLFNDSKEEKTFNDDYLDITISLKDGNGSCKIRTANYTHGESINWRIQTKGILNKFSEWSVKRTIDIYAPPTLALDIGKNVDGTFVYIEDTVESFPFYISGIAGPETQKVIGYHLAITAKESYKTIDQVGNEKVVSEGAEVYSKYFDISDELMVEMSASNIDLENNKWYVATCIVSMDSGLTAEATKEFTVAWTDLEYEPNADIQIDTETLSASIRPYAEIEYDDIEEVTWSSVSTLPHNFSYSSAVVYNNEIHILGGGTNHYKYDGSTWTSVSTLPYDIMFGSAVVYNNEIHILGGNGKLKGHYKYDGSSWIEVSTLPYDMYCSSAVIYNDEIHILGGNMGATKHYKYDGSSWTSVSTLPYNFYYGSAVIYKDEIHILGGGGNLTGHYKYDGSTWSSVSTLPHNFSYGSVIVYNDEFHIFGGGNYSKAHHKYDGSSWIEVSTSPYYIYLSSAVIYNNKIHILGGSNGGINHYECSYLLVKQYHPDVLLSVYRREFDGTLVELMTGIDNANPTWVPDPHPALDYARYRIVAIDKSTGAVSFCDLPGASVGEKSVVIQWDEAWSYFDVTNEDEMEQPPWSGSMLKLPYNIDVSDSYSPDVSLVGYIGRRNPVSYYGTQIGETANWNVEIPKDDTETLYALRRLAVWMGDVYVREPSGSGYWANIKVSFSQTHCELTIPVTLSITRVEGGI